MAIINYECTGMVVFLGPRAGLGLGLGVVFSFQLDRSAFLIE